MSQPDPDVPHAHVWKMTDDSGQWQYSLPWKSAIVDTQADAIREVGRELMLYAVKLELMDKDPETGQVTRYITGANAIGEPHGE